MEIIKFNIEIETERIWMHTLIIKIEKTGEKEKQTKEMSPRGKIINPITGIKITFDNSAIIDTILK